ncbi:tRNA (uracil-5-)-methyltransferase Gid [Streptococcus pneumoniae]|nr:tRNA (uracil-5-)-methyltransferase Gid [Streptococcus pneumoniae]
MRGDALTNAVGLLKEEMRRLGSVILESAEATRVPAGGALAVDRDGFSQMVTEKVVNHPLIEVVRDEITELPTDVITVVATGPLTSDALAEKIHALNDGDGFYFYDAAAPIIDVNTIDMSKVYLKSRYDKGEAAYLNAPMTKQEFMDFHEALVNAEEAPLNSFEKEKYFEGCMPIEVMAKRGIKTMLYGPMKPVGLEYPDDYTGPRDGEFKTPYAVVQLRQDNAAGSLYNIVGFQTHLKWGEQKRVFQMIPGLENAEFVRYGVMHRNSYMDSPNLLEQTYRSKKQPNLFFAGQMTGVEGYVESAASGLVAGINAARLFKEEMRRLGSVILESAEATRVPAGGALAVDRDGFSQMVTEKVANHPLIEVVRDEITELPTDVITVIATGPLTSDALAEKIHALNNGVGFYFYDAAAPIIDVNTIDMSKVYLKSRYDKGEAAYLNAPMTKQEFMDFHEALVNAEEAPLNSFEKEKYFEGCMPIEVMAKRGIKTMLYGPMKPVGLEYPDDYTGPRDGEFKTPYAVVQLRQDNAAGSLYNIVGFQTHLKWGEQKRVFQMIPGLENAEFVRYGVMHRNSYMDSPNLLEQTYRSKKQPNLFFAGQMTGVEGYVESAASGLVAGINAARLFKEESEAIFPETTAIGSLAHYITHADSKHFQPMNVNFGIIKELEGERIRDKKARYEKIAERALADLEEFLTV